MGYITVDIPHFIFILFIFIVCSKQIPAIYEIVQVVMILGRTYLTRIVSQMARVRERNLTPVSVYNTPWGTFIVPHGVVCLIGEFSQCRSKLHMTL